MTTETKQKPKVTAGKASGAKPTRRDQLAKLLNRKSGATIAQIRDAFGWQPHTARAAISTLRKTGIAIERRETDKGSFYRITNGARDHGQ